MIAALAALAASFGVLLVLVLQGGALVVLDGVIQSSLTPWRTRPVLLAFGWLTQAGSGGTGAAVVAAVSAVLWSAGRGTTTAPLWIALIGAEATTWSIKFLTDRPRPAFIEGLTAASPSFPSAHATVAVAVYGTLAVIVAAEAPASPRMVYLAGIAVIVLIAFSRLILSLHYLSDVIGGILIGAFWLCLALYVTSAAAD